VLNERADGSQDAGVRDIPIDVIGVCTEELCNGVADSGRGRY
jgi:hypothetical protein